MAEEGGAYKFLTDIWAVALLSNAIPLKDSISECQHEWKSQIDA